RSDVIQSDQAAVADNIGMDNRDELPPAECVRSPCAVRRHNRTPTTPAERYHWRGTTSWPSEHSKQPGLLNSRGRRDRGDAPLQTAPYCTALQRLRAMKACHSGFAPKFCLAMARASEAAGRLLCQPPDPEGRQAAVATPESQERACAAPPS